MPVKLSDDEMQALLIECRRQQAFAGVLPESAKGLGYGSSASGLDGVDGPADDAVNAAGPEGGPADSP